MTFELVDYQRNGPAEQTVLIIDDEFTSRTILGKIVQSVEADIAVVSFFDPQAAVEWLRTHQPDLIILDYRMEGMSGLEVVKLIRRLTHLIDVPVMVVTAMEARDVRYKILEEGATDFILKPIDPYECRVRCRNLLALRNNQKLVLERAQSLENAIYSATQKILEREHETLFRLAKAGEYRDSGTGNHILRMARYSRLIAEAVGLHEDRCNLIGLAAPMHDIGKIGIPDQILLKPGKLDAREFGVMKRHSMIGYEILQQSPSQFLTLGADIALGHHEKYDGSGYPQGVEGNAIPLEARIVAVADVFDALTTARPYKKAWSNEKALEYLIANKGKHFDPVCVEAFVRQFSKVLIVQQQLQDMPSTQRNSAS